MLEGADEGWNSIGGGTTLKFPNLSDGKYTLLLRARDGSGALSSNSASFAFCIEPPFWKSYWFLATVVCLTGILLYLIYRNRLNKVTELQKVRNKIAADLHDDIGSTLSSIRMYSEMVKSQIPGTSPAATHMLDKISSNARESVESMSDIVWMINPKNDSVANLIDRMELYATEMCSGKNMELDFQKGDAPDGMRIPMETRKDIYLIFKEAVNNSVKYSGASRLMVLLERTDHRIKLEVADNGSGFDVSAIRRGNGLENMMQRAKRIGGEVRIESSVESGTCITFSAGIP
jgi:signal transduction histidine kinase